MKKTLTIGLLAAAITTTLSGAPAPAPETFTFDKSHTEVSFQIRHVLSKVRGRFTDFEGSILVDRAKPEASSVSFTIKAASIDTANERRDNHLRSADFFEVEKFPTITFKSTSIKPAGKDRYDVAGTLTMHGVSKEVTLPISFLGFVNAMKGRETAGFEASVVLNRKDFGIVWNKALDNGGALLGDDVTVTFGVEAHRQLEAKPEEPKKAA